MNVDRFASVQLRIEKEMPTAADLDCLFREWGLTDSNQERLWAVAYDGIEQIRTVTEVAVGGYHEVAVPIPALLTAVLLSGADRFQIAHNHPSGDAQPTMYDVDMVHKVMDAANAAGLFFEDSLIVAEGATTYSFLQNGLIVPSKELTEMATSVGHAPFTRTPSR